MERVTTLIRWPASPPARTLLSRERAPRPRGADSCSPIHASSMIRGRQLTALGALALGAACADAPTAPSPGLRGPDGVFLIMREQDDHYDLYAALADDSKELRLTNNDVDDIDATWSPDGRQILFLSSRDSVNGQNVGRMDVWAMAPDGSRQRRVFASAWSSYHPRWSPDGRHIVFVHYFQTAPFFRLYVMNADGSGATPLAADGEDDQSPEWSPDGGRILFVNSSGGVSVMNADGTGARAISTAADCAGEIYSARWSPDGTRIAFSCGTSTGESISMMNADGSNPMPITPAGVMGSYYPADIDPVWSPAGDRIAFSSSRSSPNYQVHVVSAAGGTPTPVTASTIGSFASDWGPRAR